MEGSACGLMATPLPVHLRTFAAAGIDETIRLPFGRRRMTLTNVLEIVILVLVAYLAVRFFRKRA